MSVAVIVGNGEFPRKAYPSYLISSADTVICCDGALKSWLRNCNRLFNEEKLPDIIIGDLDSLSSKLKEKYSDRVVHISEQDFNDMTKALLYTLANFPEVDCIHFVGFGGKREDHLLGNLSLLMEYSKALQGDAEASDELSNAMKAALEPYRDRVLNIDMVSDYCTIASVSDSCELFVGEGRKVSLISTDNTLKIKSAGLEWPTDNVVFDNLWKATLNRASEDVIKLDFNHPSAVLLILS